MGNYQEQNKGSKTLVQGKSKIDVSNKKISFSH